MPKSFPKHEHTHVLTHGADQFVVEIINQGDFKEAKLSWSSHQRVTSRVGKWLFGILDSLLPGPAMITCARGQSIWIAIIDGKRQFGPAAHIT